MIFTKLLQISFVCHSKYMYRSLAVCMLKTWNNTQWFASHSSGCMQGFQTGGQLCQNDWKSLLSGHSYLVFLLHCVALSKPVYFINLYVSSALCNFCSKKSLCPCHNYCYCACTVHGQECNTKFCMPDIMHIMSRTFIILLYFRADVEAIHRQTEKFSQFSSGLLQIIINACQECNI